MFNVPGAVGALPYTWAALLFCSVAYVVGIVVYRLWFSPIANFPGPLLARITFGYQLYHNWFRTGFYYLEIAKMHQEYGLNRLCLTNT
jgi:hypothetical protein